jgi:hypothetical protein
MPLYKSLIFLFLLLVSSSLIFPFRHSLFLFLSILLVSRLKFCRLSPLIWLGFCNHCNLACFRWSINFKHSSSNHGLLCFSLWYPGLSLPEVLMFSLILSQALSMSKVSSKPSKAFSDQFFLNQTFALLVYLLKFSPSILPLPGSGQYHSQLL